jgi:exopolyphosphatase/guanosine-5'-triphosphate,3'-diphosphate pyrophosphatase
MPRFAALDVGSNALRLRIIEAHAPSRAHERLQLPLLPAERESPTGWTELLSLRAPVRLGSEVFVTGRLAPQSIGQACSALRQFREAMDQLGVDAYRATATSAVREAQNGATLVERARREARLELEVIEGVEEARLIQLAVVRRLKLEQRRAILLDVGGGSTEVTVLENGQSAFAMSISLGTVRLLETFLKTTGAHGPTNGRVGRERLKLLGETVDRALVEVLPQAKRPSEMLVGTGGNVETLADLCPVRSAPGGRGIDVATMKTLVGKMASMTTDERRAAWNLRPDRAETIVPASIIFLKAAQAFGAKHVVVPGAGLKEGILEELVDKYFDVWDAAGEATSVLAACRRLGARYSFDERHAELVARFATQLFDDLASVHAFGARERLLVQAAALLHDIGDYVRYDGHHKHSYYLVMHAEILGLLPEERAVVANIARYHRKSAPDIDHPNFRELDKVSRGKVRALAAILRLADALDREHRGKVEDVHAEVDRSKRSVVLRLGGRADRELEEWAVVHKSELFRDVFDLEVTLAPAEAPISSEETALGDAAHGETAEPKTAVVPVRAAEEPKKTGSM